MKVFLYLNIQKAMISSLHLDEPYLLSLDTLKYSQVISRGNSKFDKHLGSAAAFLMLYWPFIGELKLNTLTEIAVYQLPSETNDQKKRQGAATSVEVGARLLVF